MEAQEQVKQVAEGAESVDAPPQVSLQEVLSLIDKAQEGESQELSLTDLYDRIYADEDIIIVIDAVNERNVRKGLSSIKAKRNAKLRDNDLPTDESTLEFISHEDKELKAMGRVRLQIYMKKKATVTVHSLKVAEGL